MTSIVKVKRPAAVADFLRDYPPEERHRLSNELMLIGVQQLRLAELARHHVSSPSRERRGDAHERTAAAAAVATKSASHSPSARQRAVKSQSVAHEAARNRKRTVLGDMVTLETPSPPRRTSSRLVKRQAAKAWFCSLEGDIAESIPAATTRASKRGAASALREADFVEMEAPRSDGRPPALMHDELASDEITTSGPVTISPAMASHTTSDDPFHLMSPSDRTPEEPPLLRRSTQGPSLQGPWPASTADNSPKSQVGTSSTQPFSVPAMRSPNSHFVVVANNATSPVSAPPPQQNANSQAAGLIDVQQQQSADFFGDSGSTRVIASGTSGGTVTPPLYRGLTKSRYPALDTVFTSVGIRSTSPSVSRQSSMQTTPSFQAAFTIASSEHFATPRSLLSDSGRVPKFESQLRRLIESTRGARLPFQEVLASVTTSPDVMHHDDVAKRYNELLVLYHTGHAKTLPT